LSVQFGHTARGSRVKCCWCIVLVVAMGGVLLVYMPCCLPSVLLLSRDFLFECLNYKIRKVEITRSLALLTVHPI
jgi:hypothetical protein